MTYKPRTFFKAKLEPKTAVLHEAGQDIVGFKDYSHTIGVPHQPTIYMSYIRIAGNPKDVVASFCYISWEWKYWSDKLGFSWHDWGDCRIESNAYVTEQFRKEMALPLYQHAKNHTLLPSNKKMP